MPPMEFGIIPLSRTKIVIGTVDWDQDLEASFRVTNKCKEFSAWTELLKCNCYRWQCCWRKSNFLSHAEATAVQNSTLSIVSHKLGLMKCLISFSKKRAERFQLPASHIAFVRTKKGTMYRNESKMCFEVIQSTAIQFEGPTLPSQKRIDFSNLNFLGSDYAIRCHCRRFDHQF